MIALFENEFDFEKDLDGNRWIWKIKRGMQTRTNVMNPSV
jgi:hypothetical protein